MSTEFETLSRGEAVTLRPNFAAYGKALRSRARYLGAFVAIALLGQVLQAGSIGGATLRLGGIAAVIGLCVAGIAIHFRSARITLTPESVERSGRLVRHRRFATDTVEGLLVHLHQPMTVPTRMLVVAGPDRRGRRQSVRLSAAVWSDDQLEAIALHADIAAIPGVLKGADVERLLPGSMPFWYRRPWLFATLVTIALFAAIVGAVLGFWIATERPPFDDRGPAEESAAAAPATVDDQTAVLDTVRESLDGSWDPIAVRYRECEHDNVKGWARSATLVRPAGAAPTTDQLESLARDLGAHGFEDAWFSRPPDPWLEGGLVGDSETGWRRVEIAVSDDGAVWAQVSSPCLVG